MHWIYSEMESYERIGDIYLLFINKFLLKIIQLMTIIRDFVRFIFVSPTKWISASHSTGFFCAVKVLTTKDFAKLWNSIRPFQPGKNASKTSLILRFSLKQRDMSFREWVFTTHWTTPSNKTLPQGWFLIVLAPRKSFFRENDPVCATFV